MAHGSNWQRTGQGLVLSVAEIAAVTAATWALQHFVPVYALAGLYVLTILPIATGWGFRWALAVAVASTLTFNYFFIPPLFTLTLTDAYTATSLLIAIATAYVVSELSRHAQLRAREAESLASDISAADAQVRRIADEQAALRRVATLVARAAAPDAVFASVTAEVGRVLSADVTLMSRYDPEDTATIVGVWGSAGADAPTGVGTRFELGGRNVHTLVSRTGRLARTDRAEASGPATDAFRLWSISSCVGVPISVEDRLWGVMIVVSTGDGSLPSDTEARLAGFTELVATAIANAEAQAALTESRARVVRTADETRRRIERDLHDGAQQRLVSMALQLRAAQAAVPPGAGELTAQLDGMATDLRGVLDELREISRGIHPAVLARGGLRPALRALARRSAVPVRLNAGIVGRLPEPIEVAAYYVVSEALTNTAKHAKASVVEIEAEVEERDGVLRVRVRDDGCGGADYGAGSGLIGLKDRIDALGGRVSVESAPGAGTCVQVELPLGGPDAISV
jgi:signal transduction histidine kinase